MAERAESQISRSFSRMPFLLGQLLDWPTELYPDRNAIEGEFGAVTFQQLSAKIEDRANELREMGVATGDRIGLAYSDGLQFVTDLFALWNLNCTASPLRTSWPEGRIKEAVKSAQISKILGNEAFVGEPISNKHKHGPTDLDIALILWTSGTSGPPRGVALQHHAVIANILGNINSLGIQDGDRTLMVLPLSHAYSLVAQCLCHLAVGGTLCFPTLPLIPTSLARAVDQQEITTISLVPPLLAFFIDGLKRIQSTCPTLRLITVGAARANAAELEALQNLVPSAQIALTYGLTEAGPRVATRFLRGNSFDPGDLGFPLPNVSVAVRDGEVTVRSRSQMLGYVDELSASDLELPTGDLGNLEGDGIQLTGRIGRSINRGGLMISPERIESVLLTHPRVTKCLVTSMPHKLFGEAPVARVCGDSVTIEELLRWCGEHLPVEEVPVGITLCDSLEPDRKATEMGQGFKSEETR